MNKIGSILGERAGESSVAVLIGLRDRESVQRYFSKRFGENIFKTIELFEFNHKDAKGWLILTETRIIFYINQDMNKFKEYDLVKWIVDDFSEINLKEIGKNEIELAEKKSLVFDPSIISKKRLISEMLQALSQFQDKKPPIKNLGLSENQKKFLLKVYVGQNINDGILYKFKEKKYVDNDEEKIAKSLISMGLIKEIFPYSSVKTLRTFITLIEGASLSKELIEEKLKNGKKILGELNSIPKKILGFLLIDMDKLIFDLEHDKEFVFEWEDFLLNNKKVSGFLSQLCKTLEKNKFAVLTNNYVSSKGGRIDPKEYIISSEIKEHLIKNFNLRALDELEVNELILLYSIYQIKEILEIEDVDRRRNRFWNLLQGVPFDETSIEKVINKFGETGITTRYNKVEEDKFLFTILDDKKFDKELNNLVNRFVLGISLETPGKEDLIKTKDLFKLHSELFGLIGNFEIKIRNFILNEIGTDFAKTGGNWEECLRNIDLLEKLKLRENQDIESGMIPEKELIYYADILDYKEIILSNWHLFSDKLSKKGVTEEILDYGLKEINRIRRKVMHLREIRKGERENLRFFILPRIEKIFR